MVSRGEIWWADFGEPRGSEPGYKRPVVVIQSNDFNASMLRTILVAVITSTEQLAFSPGNVRLSKRVSGLPKASVVNITQLYPLDRKYLIDRVRMLPAQIVKQIDEGLRLVLTLEST